MKTFIIQENVVKAIIAYLQKRPYEEVADGIQALANLVPYAPAESSASKDPVAKP